MPGKTTEYTIRALV